MKEKPTLKQEDFIKKYYGYKILDRIDEIVSAEIGDEDRLFSIYEKIKKKKEFDADEIQYLMDCSEELDYVKKYYGDKIEELDEKETELPTNKKKISRVESTLLGDDPSSPLYTKGTSGFYGKRNVGKRKITIAIIIPIMFILLVGIIMSSDDSDREIQQEFQTEDLPQSCDGINAVRYDLYPNLDECLDAIVERINFACYAKSNGDEYETIGCVLDITSLLNEQCQGSEDMGLLSVSFEACLWNQYYHVYKNLGNFCWKDEDMMQCLADVKIGK